MDYHLDYGLRLNTELKHNSLYKWAINEVDADGSPINGDQIPWEWTLFFSATSCVLTNRFEMARNSRKSGPEEPLQIKSDQAIRMTLRSEWGRGGDGVIFSMFGTNRAIREFVLEVHPLNNSEEAERCSAWGCISYTAERDFRFETAQDCMCFYLDVKPETFTGYVDLINRGAIDDILFNVNSVDGFYSDWTPSVSTDKLKVLLDEKEHKFDLPPDFSGDLPRLGKVRDARLLLHRRLKLDKNLVPPLATDEAADPAPPLPSLNSALQTPNTDPRLLPVLASLKKAAWIVVALLAVIALIVLQKH